MHVRASSAQVVMHHLLHTFLRNASGGYSPPQFMKKRGRELP